MNDATDVEIEEFMSRLVRAPQVDRQWLAFAEIAAELKRLNAHLRADFASPIIDQESALEP
jgi:hypothetical protein